MTDCVFSTWWVRIGFWKWPTDAAIPTSLNRRSGMEGNISGEDKVSRVSVCRDKWLHLTPAVCHVCLRHIQSRDEPCEDEYVSVWFGSTDGNADELEVSLLSPIHFHVLSLDCSIDVILHIVFRVINFSLVFTSAAKSLWEGVRSQKGFHQCGPLSKIWTGTLQSLD